MAPARSLAVVAVTRAKRLPAELKPARVAVTSSLNALAKLKLPAVKPEAELVAAALAAAVAPEN
jgi:hypothetical protein